MPLRGVPRVGYVTLSSLNTCPRAARAGQQSAKSVPRSHTTRRPPPLCTARFLAGLLGWRPSAWARHDAASPHTHRLADTGHAADIPARGGLTAPAPSAQKEPHLPFGAGPARARPASLSPQAMPSLPARSRRPPSRFAPAAARASTRRPRHPGPAPPAPT